MKILSYPRVNYHGADTSVPAKVGEYACQRNEAVAVQARQVGRFHVGESRSTGPRRVVLSGPPYREQQPEGKSPPEGLTGDTGGARGQDLGPPQAETGPSHANKASLEHPQALPQDKAKNLLNKPEKQKAEVPGRQHMPTDA